MIGVCLHRDKMLATGNACCDYLYTKPGSEIEKELSEKPLAEIVQEHAGKLRYFDVQQYCKVTDWEDLC